VTLPPADANTIGVLPPAVGFTPPTQFAVSEKVVPSPRPVHVQASPEPTVRRIDFASEESSKAVAALPLAQAN
jgi:hypothetical protein